jgi:hypothetical protein
MHHSRKVVQGLLAFAVLAAPLSASWAARSIMGNVMDTGPVDPFAGRCVEERIWSGVDQDSISQNAINNCTTTGIGSCSLGFNATDKVCYRSWQANLQASGRSGYSSFQDDKGVYNNDSPDQPMYILWENIQNETATNYSPYYYAASQIVSDADLGKISDSNCVGTVAVACFLPGTATRNGGALNNVPNGPRNPIGGLGAIPIPVVGSPTGNTVDMTWAPIAVFDNGQGAPNPFKFYRLFRWTDPVTNATCDSPVQSDPGWTEIGTSITPSFTDSALPSGVDCVRYSLKPVFNGPALLNSFGTAPGELSTRFRSEPSAGVARNPAAFQIANFDARYAGMGVINVRWTGVVETGLAGYYAGQSLNSAGPFRRIGAIVPLKGDGSNYVVPNKVNLAGGTTVWYQLEMVGADGSINTLSPVSITLPITSQ